MSVKIVGVEKELPEYSRETKDILPLVENWLEDQEDRYRRKVLKIFEGAAVDKRYSIMKPEEVFTATSFEDKNNIYVREVKKLGKNVAFFIQFGKFFVQRASSKHVSEHF